MIQELFGASAPGLLNKDPNPSPSPSSSTTTTTTTTATTTTATAADNQKLRCPRCDSAHTKFCYYNNYNLTQPRHFCKTCRRYWTKGGALRNVPIGGGCRKNKTTTISSATGKLKAAVSSELGKSSIINGNLEIDSNLNPNPILWSTPPQTSHLLSLFRATQNPNPNPNPNFASNPITHTKDHNFLAGTQMGTLGFDIQTSTLGLCSSLWRNSNNNNNNNNNNNQQDHQNQHNMGNYYHHHDIDQHVPVILGGNIGNASSGSSTILDSAPVIAGGELGFWNQTLAWSDLAATNGAYP